MIHLLFAIVFAVLIYVCFRLISIYKLDEFQVIVINYLTAVILGVILWQEPLDPEVITNSSWFPLSIFIGVSFIITFYLFAVSSAKAGISLTAVSSKMSVLLPVTAGVIFFGESLGTYKIIGIILALISFLLVFSKGSKQKIRKEIIILPILIFIGSGTNDSLTKYAQHSLLDGDDALFLITLFFISFIFSTLFIILRFIVLKKKISLRSILAGIVVGIVNFSTMYFLLAALNHFEASLVFPILNVSVVLLSALIGVLLFKEKLSKLNIAGIIVAALSIILIGMS